MVDRRESNSNNVNDSGTDLLGIRATGRAEWRARCLVLASAVRCADDACVYIFRCEFVLVYVNVEMRGMHEKCRATPHTQRDSRVCGICVDCVCYSYSAAHGNADGM